MSNRSALKARKRKHAELSADETTSMKSGIDTLAEGEKGAPHINADDRYDGTGKQRGGELVYYAGQWGAK